MSAKKKNSKFAEESAKQSTGPSLAMVQLFAKPEGDGGTEMKNLVRRNLPQLVKPESVPMGGIVSGEIIQITEQESKTKDGKMFSLWLRHHTGTEFLFPVGGVIRNALLPGVDRKNEKAIRDGLEGEIGKQFVATRTPDKQSDTFKKKMFMFDVFTSGK